MQVGPTSIIQAHGVMRHHSFLYKGQNNCTNKQLRMNKHLFMF